MRHELLHDVRRVGAQHHELAVGHVDDAHHAEGDGQADGDEDEHRADAQAEEEGLQARVERLLAVDALEGRRGGLAHGRIRLGEAAVVVLLEQGRQAVVHLRPEPAGERGDRVEPGLAVAAVERGQRQADLDLLLHVRVGLDAVALFEQDDVPFVERPQDLVHRRQPRGRVGAVQPEPGDGDADRLAQGVVGPDAGEVVARRGPGVGERHRIDQREHGQAVVVGLDDEDALVGVAVEEPVVEQRREHRLGAVMAARGELIDNLLLLGIGGVAQLSQRGEEAGVAGRCGRLRDE